MTHRPDSEDVEVIGEHDLPVVGGLNLGQDRLDRRVVVTARVR